MSDLNEYLGILRNRVSILDVISKYVKLTKRGHNYFGLCPFHREKTGSFKVDPLKGFYYCFGCGDHGDMFKFVMQIEHASFMEAVEKISASVNMSVPKFAPSQNKDHPTSLQHAMILIKDYYTKQLKECKNTAVKDYINYRGISEDSLRKFEIGYANSKELFQLLKMYGFSEETLLKTGVFFRSYGGLKDKFEGRVIFPICDRMGKCIGFGGRTIDNGVPKYLNSPETDFFKKSDNLYGYNVAKKGKYPDLILVEGYLDVISMHEAGFDKTVACLGTTISETQIDLCWKISDAPIVMLDGDAPGIKAAHRWLLKILPKLVPGKTFKFVTIPNNGDPDSAVKSGGAQYVADVLKTAHSLEDWLWDSSFLLYPSQTPEAAASVLKSISEAIDTIADRTIRALYKKWFKEKEDSLLFRNRNAKYRKKNNVSAAVEAVSPKIKKFQEILLATIINHPNILDNVIEKFVELDFKTSSYNKLKEEIINAYTEKNDLEKTIEKIYNENRHLLEYVKLHAGFSGRSSSHEEAVDGWMKVCNEYIAITSGKDELCTIVSDLEKSFSYDDWKRLKALKHASLCKQEE